MARKASGSPNNVVTSRKLTFGFGQSRTVRTRPLRNAASSDGFMDSHRDQEPRHRIRQGKRTEDCEGNQSFKRDDRGERESDKRSFAPTACFPASTVPPTRRLPFVASWLLNSHRNSYELSVCSRVH